MVIGSLLLSLMLSQPENYGVSFLNAAPIWGELSRAAEGDWIWAGPFYCWAWPRDRMALGQLGSI